jgi:hypothetical protein
LLLFLYKKVDKKLAKQLAGFAQSTVGSGKNLIITLVFDKKRQFVREKLAKIAENSYYNIDPRSG